jgi:hypothetical protein
MVIQRNSHEPLESSAEIDPLPPVATGSFRAIKSRTSPQTSIGGGASQINQFLAAQ